MLRVPTRGRSLVALLMVFGLIIALWAVPLAGAADPATTRVVSSTELLRPGQSGPAVTDLQTALVEVGQNPGPIDGIFGSLTTAAVRAFQDQTGITVDGLVGPGTRAAIRNAVGGPTDRPALSPGASGDRVVALQQALSRTGFYRGPLDATSAR